MNQLTPEQHKRRAQMLRAHYEDQATGLGDTHDYRSPREWNRQAFRLQVKTTLFHLAIKLIILAAIVAIAIAMTKQATWLHYLGLG